EDMNDDIYSFLLYTGYLKIQDKVYDDSGKQIADTYKLVIPNKEVKTIYDNIFMKWFDEYQRVKRNTFIGKLLDEKEKEAQKIMNDVLKNSISYYDNYESFYHGFMIGFLKADGYEVKSNRESGEGRFDIMVIPYEIDETAIIIECKHSKNKAVLKKESEDAAKQIIGMNYQQGLKDEGYDNVIGFGISFFKKQCYITKI
ncbi:PD-(D/E)XK nuclease superfamily protein, partial [Thomasclavelia cocleata]